MDWSAVDMGDLPTWLGAIGTVGTLVAALMVLAHDRKASRANDDERRRAQASQIAASVRVAANAGRSPLGEPGFVLEVDNASAQPIYDAVALIVDAATGVGIATASAGQVSPGDTRVVPVDLPGRDFLDRCVAVLGFRGSNGLAWRRDGRTGALTQQASPDLVARAEAGQRLADREAASGTDRGTDPV